MKDSSGVATSQPAIRVVPVGLHICMLKIHRHRGLRVDIEHVQRDFDFLNDRHIFLAFISYFVFSVY